MSAVIPLSDLIMIQIETAQLHISRKFDQNTIFGRKSFLFVYETTTFCKHLIIFIRIAHSFRDLNSMAATMINSTDPLKGSIYRRLDRSGETRGDFDIRSRKTRAPSFHEI